MARTPKKKKNQLPSGSYRVQVYSHADADGKKHYKSFTAPSKKLAQAAANDWLAKRDAGIETPDDLTVCEAITRYVNVKKGVLSPAPKNKYWKFQLPSSDMFAAALFHQGLSCQKSYPHSLDARGPRSKIVDI